MVARLVATFLLVLCILPVTAPFSTVDSTHPLGGQSPVTTIAPAATHASVADSDDDDALVLERSTFLKHSRLCANMVVGFCDTVIVSALFLPSVAPPILSLDSPPLNTILRL